MDDNVENCTVSGNTTTTNTTDAQTIPVASDWILYSVSGVLFFISGLGASFVFSSWETIAELFYESSLARYETMTGDRGPATYLVFHNDVLDELQLLATASDDILGVEQDKRSNVAKIAFTGAQVHGIELVRQLPGVASMMRRNVPMMCH